MNKVKDLDLYKLLEVAFDSDEATLRKAYRKKALKCHPDKNPDDPKAAELFHQVSNFYLKSLSRPFMILWVLMPVRQKKKPGYIHLTNI